MKRRALLLQEWVLEGRTHKTRRLDRNEQLGKKTGSKSPSESMRGLMIPVDKKRNRRGKERTGNKPSGAKTKPQRKRRGTGGHQWEGGSKNIAHRKEKEKVKEPMWNQHQRGQPNALTEPVYCWQSEFGVTFKTGGRCRNRGSSSTLGKIHGIRPKVPRFAGP